MSPPSAYFHLIIFSASESSSPSRVLRRVGFAAYCDFTVGEKVSLPKVRARERERVRFLSASASPCTWDIIKRRINSVLRWNLGGNAECIKYILNRQEVSPVSWDNKKYTCHGQPYGRSTGNFFKSSYSVKIVDTVTI